MDLGWLNKDTVVPRNKNIALLAAGLCALYTMSMTEEERREFLNVAYTLHHVDQENVVHKEKTPVDPKHTCKICEQNAWSIVMTCSHALCDICVEKMLIKNLFD